MTSSLKLIGAAAVLAGSLVASATALAAEPIIGTWKLPEGALAKVSPCGGSYCFRLISGEFAGTNIGKMSGKGGNYEGSIKDPRDNKTYRGKAWMAGNNLKMRGYSGVFWKTNTWKRN